MSIQRNVAQQNGDIRFEIESSAAELSTNGSRFLWLSDLLKEHGLSKTEGLLVRILHTPEQEGDLYSVTWLTHTRRFWSFSVVLDRQTSKLIEVEQAEDITDQESVAMHMRGKGMSFGAIAIEFLNEKLAILQKMSTKNE